MTTDRYTCISHYTDNSISTSDFHYNHYSDLTNTHTRHPTCDTVDYDYPSYGDSIPIDAMFSSPSSSLCSSPYDDQLDMPDFRYSVDVQETDEVTCKWRQSRLKNQQHQTEQRQVSIMSRANICLIRCVEETLWLIYDCLHRLIASLCLCCSK